MTKQSQILNLHTEKEMNSRRVHLPSVYHKIQVKKERFFIVLFARYMICTGYRRKSIKGIENWVIQNLNMIDELHFLSCNKAAELGTST